jgi:hypothetical protein
MEPFLGLFKPVYFEGNECIVDADAGRRVSIHPTTFTGRDRGDVIAHMERQAAYTVLASAVGSNATVHHPGARPGEITEHLVFDIRRHLSHTCHRLLTGLFLDADQPLPASAFGWLTGVSVHPVSHGRWNSIRDYFFGSGGRLARGDEDFVIGVAASHVDNSFVRAVPRRPNHPEIVKHPDSDRWYCDAGISVVNPNRIVIGSY